MLGGIGDVFRASSLCAETIRDVTATMTRTVAFENESLCTALLAEHGVFLHELDDLARYRIVRAAVDGVSGGVSRAS